MIDFDFKNHCTGCQVCGDVCPKSCITFKHDEYGFVLPHVDVTLCIDCGRCEKACPVLSKKSRDLHRHVFCTYNLNSTERQLGSSGSIMMLLANEVIGLGGRVYGAAFDENMIVKHTCASTYEELRKQAKSKYIQSNTRGVYQSVLSNLKDELFVMFVGTPCQCEALSNIVPQHLRKKLLIVDFICHGVPSQKLFNDSIKEYEKRRKCKVTSFSFREKSQDYLRNFKITYVKAGIKYDEIGKEDTFPFYYAFLRHYSFRNSCFDCRFANSSRMSDITLGDMWGIEKNDEVEDFHKGYSLIYTNTTEGQEWYNRIISKCRSKEFDLNDKRVFNYAYSLPTHKNLWNIVFRFCYKNISYSFTERLLCRKFEDVNKLHKVLLLVLGKLNKYYSLINKASNGN